jgi:hypothetical protein
MSALNYDTSLVGLNLSVRQHGFALAYDASNWTSPKDSSWSTYHHRDDQFRHRDFPHHVVTVERDRIVVAQILPTKPDLVRAAQLSRLALGPDAGDSIVCAHLFPLSIRVPLTASADWSSSLPERDFREMRILPSEKAAPKTVHIFGSDAELRVSASRVRGHLRIYGEIFPNGLHQRFEGEVRRMLFPADARRASIMSGAHVVRSHLASALVELLQFVVRVREIGLEVETNKVLPGWRIGSVVERDGVAWLDVKMPPLYEVPPFSVPLLGQGEDERNASAANLVAPV